MVAGEGGPLAPRPAATPRSDSRGGGKLVAPAALRSKVWQTPGYTQMHGVASGAGLGSWFREVLDRSRSMGVSPRRLSNRRPSGAAPRPHVRHAVPAQGVASGCRLSSARWETSWPQAPRPAPGAPEPGPSRVPPVGVVKEVSMKLRREGRYATIRGEQSTGVVPNFVPGVQSSAGWPHPSQASERTV